MVTLDALLEILHRSRLLKQYKDSFREVFEERAAFWMSVGRSSRALRDSASKISAPRFPLDEFQG